MCYLPGTVKLQCCPFGLTDQPTAPLLDMQEDIRRWLLGILSFQMPHPFPVVVVFLLLALCRAISQHDCLFQRMKEECHCQQFFLLCPACRCYSLY